VAELTEIPGRCGRELFHGVADIDGDHAHVLLRGERELQ
jgi:hypothetical protein